MLNWVLNTQLLVDANCFQTSVKLHPTNTPRVFHVETNARNVFTGYENENTRVKILIKWFDLNEKLLEFNFVDVLLQTYFSIV